MEDGDNDTAHIQEQKGCQEKIVSLRGRKPDHLRELD